MEDNKYGLNGYDFADDVNISDTEIEEWIQDCKQTLLQEQGRFAINRSGNTMVIAIKNDEGLSAFGIDIYVCKDYFALRL